MKTKELRLLIREELAKELENSSLITPINEKLDPVGKEDDDIQKYFINQAFPDEHLVNTILNTIEKWAIFNIQCFKHTNLSKKKPTINQSLTRRIFML